MRTTAPGRTLIRLLHAYQRHGYRIRTGLNPCYLDNPDAAFPRLLGADGEPVEVGAGLAPQELYFLECLLAAGVQPRRVLVIGNALGGDRIDLVLVDGLHTSEQLVRDVEGVRPHASEACVFLLHDVLSWHMLDGYLGLPLQPDEERRILTRCPSGSGLI